MSVCNNCGTEQRHSDTYGCCDACGRLFKGLGAFDRHWTTPGPGERVCVDPESVRDGKGRLVFETVPVAGGVAWRLISRGELPDWAKRTTPQEPQNRA